MKILLHYLKPHKWLVILVLTLAAINIGFSLVDPIILGRLINLATYHTDPHFSKWHDFLFAKATITEKIPKINKNGVVEVVEKPKFLYGMVWLLLASISVAMISRIAKNFQDYFLNVVIQKFGAKVFTDGLQHAMKLPYSEFEDQRSGETLSVLTKVRADVEKFMTNFINILFGVLVGVVFVFIYAAIFINWRIPVAYLVGIFVLTFITNKLSKKIKIIQKNILGETTALAGSTTESLRNIELVKSLGLSKQEVNRLNSVTGKILTLELKKVRFIRSLSFVQGTTVNFLRTCLIFLLYYLVFKDTITPGKLMTLMFYSFFIFGPLQELGNVIAVWREAQASLQNFKEIMSTPVEAKPANPRKLEKINHLRFEQVQFRHQSSSTN